MRTMILTLILVATAGLVYPCTSAVISGKATADGRPLLWKHRDTGDLENKLVFLEGSKFNLVGVANTNDTLSQQIWMGANEAGFAIMNTASYNLNEGQVCVVPDDQEGLFMRAVLEICSDIRDFEAFMDSSQGKWGVSANFGVIDAKGGAAYYEKGYYDYQKYDVTDPAVAPEGYLIRTNYSMSGTDDKGYGFIRHDVTTELFGEQEALSVDFMLGSATRNFKHGLLGNDLRHGSKPLDLNDEKYVLFQDYVVRRYSASTLLIQGVLADENPQLTTLWTVLGWQPTTMVTPVWVRSAELLPALVVSENGESTPMNSAALALKAKCFPIQRGNGQDYLLHSQLTNQAGTGILDIILPAETEIIERTTELQEKWRKRGVKDRDLKKYNKWLERYIRETYQEKLGQVVGE